MKPTRLGLPLLLLIPLLASAEPDPAVVKKADAGDPVAEVQLYDELINAAETDAQHAEALKYLRRAANRGHGMAQQRLAVYIEESMEDTEANRTEAAHWMRKAADQKMAYAQQAFGFWAAQGTGTKRDLPTAVHYLKLAAAQGDHDALSYLVKLFSQGEDFFGNKQPVDIKEAIRWQERIALAPGAQDYQRWSLARLYLQQPVVPAADRAKAEKIVAEQMANGGSMDDAMRALLGEKFANEVAPTDLVAIWRKHAQTGNPESMFRFAELLEEAQPEEAYQWYFKAADKGYAPAGLMAFEILFEQSSMDAAQHRRQYGYLLRAAESGHAPAQYRLGKFLDDSHPMNGDFAARDAAAAAGWFRQAAEQKHVDALFDWGLAQAWGEGVPRDLPGGLKSITAAAEAGKPEAQLYLADLYATGEDQLKNKVPVDLPAAISWRRKLVESGDETAVVSLAAHLVRQPGATEAHRAEARQLLKKQAAEGSQAATDALVELKLVPTAPAIDPRIVAREKLAARYAEFEKEFDAATNRAGREKAMDRLARWIRDEPAAPLTAAEAGEWVLTRMIGRLQRYPGEAFHIVTAAPEYIIPNEMIKRVLPAGLQESIRIEANRIPDGFAVEQVKKGGINQHWDAAHAGDGTAQLALGLAYLSLKDGAIENWAHAVHWLTQANNQKIPGAYAPLKKLSDEVNARVQAAAVAEDWDALLKIYRQKADSPLPDAADGAMRAARMLLEEGRGRAQDIPEAVKLLTQAADAGRSEAAMELAFLYLGHGAQPVDETAALRWLRRAADAGNAAAKPWVELLGAGLAKPARAERAFELGQQAIATTTEGNHSTVDFGGAVPWMNYATALDHPEATAFVAMRYYESNPEAAMEIYHRAADLGSASAATFLASTYFNGWGVEKDLVLAREYRLKAAAGGGLSEQNKAGVTLMRGQGGSIDLAGARAWFLKAATQGQLEAMYHLGALWFEHKYTREGTEAEAVGWWRKAAEGGERDAQFQLGLLHHFGRSSVAKDAALARRWITASAKQRHEPAVLALKQIYGETLAEASAPKPAAQTTLAQNGAGAEAGDATRKKEDVHEAELEKLQAV
ncbi:MAG TPA: hypothetical protein VHN79_07670, partial [Lacunisphaera sp.]|nr:hypothetical protein [Lacunisphaera sp.]